MAIVERMKCISAIVCKALCNKNTTFHWQSNIENFLLHGFVKKYGVIVCIFEGLNVETKGRRIEMLQFPKLVSRYVVQKSSWEQKVFPKEESRIMVLIKIIWEDFLSLRSHCEFF